MQEGIAELEDRIYGGAWICSFEIFYVRVSVRKISVKGVDF